MRRWIRIVGLAVLASCLSACLTTREVIEVLPDGRVQVTMEAEGDVRDLTDGFPLPMDPAWRPANTDTERWVSAVGRDLGRPELRDRAEADPWLGGLMQRGTPLKLSVTADPMSAAELPVSHAPSDLSFASAFLTRHARLRVETRGPQTVYVFDRVIHRRDGTLQRLWRDTTDRLASLGDKLEAGGSLSADERARVAEALKDVMGGSALWYVRTAVGALYDEGAAGLSLARRDQVMERVAQVIEDRLDPRELSDAVALLEREARSESSDRGRAGRWLEDKEGELRVATRSSLTEALGQSGLPAPSVNGILHRFEWLLTSTDHTEDLQDDTFEVTVSMPGTIVSGNFLRREGKGRATWSWSGRDLLDRDLHVHVVSVVE